MARNQVAHIRSDTAWLNIIAECRRSGLADKEWCARNDIALSSFYSAIRRLRKKASSIPERTKHAVYDLTAHSPDVVRIDIAPETKEENDRALPGPAASVAMEFSLYNTPLRIYNGIDPALLVSILRLIRSEV